MADLRPFDAHALARRAIGLVVLATTLTGCGLFRAPETPMPTLDLTVGDGQKCLAVLLPGRLSRPEAFVKAGFDDVVTARGLALDVVAADAHLGYYRDRSVVERLRADVILPARAAGYDTIWLVGTSLGGLGGLLYLRDHPEDITGVLALAPFLGKNDVIKEIEAVGGAAAWVPPETVPDGDVSRELWSWLAPWTQGEQPVPLHIGWGTRDGLARANELLANELPDDRVYTIDGKHDEATWAKLWGHFLDRTELCRPIS